MNTNYSIDQPSGQIGAIVDTRDRVVESHSAAEPIPFGRLVCRSNDPAKPDSCRLPRLSTGVLVFSADLITANVVNGSVNGEAIDPVTFATDHDTTMAALVDAIEELETVHRAVLDPDDSDNRTVLIEVVDTDAVLASWAVTSGDTQATITASAVSNLEQVLGVALFDHTRENPGDGGAQYAATDTVSVLRRGHVRVETVDEGDAHNLGAMAAKLQANAVFGGAHAGMFAMLPGAESENTVPLENSRYTGFDIGSEINAASLEINFPASLAGA